MKTHTDIKPSLKFTGDFTRSVDNESERVTRAASSSTPGCLRDTLLLARAVLSANQGAGLQTAIHLLRNFE